MLPGKNEMKGFLIKIFQGIGFGVGLFASYVAFVFILKSGILPEDNEFKDFFTSHEKVKMAHIIGVYEGDYPDGNTHRGGYHPDGRIDVTVKNNPNAESIILVLTSYEPVNWHIQVHENATVEKVILSGYHSSKVTGLDDTPILRESWGYSYKKGSSIEAKVQKETGVEVYSFQGSYKGKSFDIY